jgi:hypothetical protein
MEERLFGDGTEGRKLSLNYPSTKFKNLIRKKLRKRKTTKREPTIV